MRSLVYNKTTLLFLNYKETLTYTKKELLSLKNQILNQDNHCIIYNYFDLKLYKSGIKDKINKLKFINQKNINARECILNEVSPIEKRDFLNKYHIQNNDKSQIYYGAYYKNELISIISFDSVKGINGGLGDNEYDLSRFAIKHGFICVGIFTRLLKRFINEYNPSRIISYGDLNYVNKHNNLYTINNFKLSKTIPPDYKFYNCEKNKVFHKLTYGNLYRKNISKEDEIILDKNLIKIWNLGKLKYELLINNKVIIFGVIYQIRNKINNKIYIGQTTRNLKKRIYEYKSGFNNGTLQNTILLNSFKKYGFDNFDITTIDTATTLDELNNKEIYYINKFNSTNPEIGYNIEIGGRNSIPSEETLKKMSIAHSGKKQNHTWIKKRISLRGSEEAKKYGKPKSEDDKKYLSENSPKFWAGKNRSEDTKTKISETKKINGLSNKQKELLCKRVIAYNPITNETINLFESTGDAAKFYNTSQSTISRKCSNKVKNKGDVFFKYEI